MSDKKISQLTGATTPLVGTEVLPIVQSGVTVKVPNNDLRPKQIQSNATSGVLQVTGPAAASTRIMTTPDANFTVARTDAAQTFTGNQTVNGNVIATSGTATPVLRAHNTTAGLGSVAEFQLDTTNTFSGTSKTFIKGESQNAGNSSADLLFGVNADGGGAPYNAVRVKGNGGDLSVLTGNLVIGTSGKGIDFSATSGTGTSELLADYEEGTWTPAFTNCGTASASSAKYTKVGRLVTIQLTMTATSLVANSSFFTLPFTSGALSSGTFTRSTTDGGFVEVQASSACYFSSTPVLTTGSLLSPQPI